MRNRFGILLVLLLMPGPLNSQTLYTTSQLSNMASLLENRTVPHYSRCDRYGYVEHLGVPLFAKAQRTVLPKIVCDFLERYNLHLRLLERNERNKLIDDDNVKVIVDEFLRVDSLCDFSLNETDRYYTAVWSKGKKQICEFSFEKSFPLISGMNVAENQRYFWKMITDTLLVFDKTPVVELSKLREEPFYLVEEGDSYMISALRSDTYYSKRDSMPLKSIFYPVQTWSNIFMGVIESGIEAEASLLLYDFSKVSDNVSIDRLVRYCKSEGCSPYWGLEYLDDGSIKASALFVNRHYSYCHLVYLDVDSDDWRIKLDINTYIPTHKLKSLYDEKR